ncbi:MAG TPA: hypothetical protein VI653_24450 [Steroidobacteraceae bacterium]
MWLSLAATTAAQEAHAQAVSASIPDGPRYYAGSFAPAYADLVAIMKLKVWCREHFDKQCDPSLTVDSPGVDAFLEQLRLVTVVDLSSVDSELKAGFATVADLHRALTAHQVSLMEHQKAFDKDVIAKYSAVMASCPDPTREGEKKFVNQTVTVELDRYWGIADDTRELSEINEDIKFHLSEVRSWPTDLCQHARDFGHLLVAQLYRKVKPYIGPDWEKFHDDDKLIQAAGYIHAVGLRFESLPHPEVIDRAKEIDARLASPTTSPCKPEC